jgi:hypothetical protein
MVDADQTIIVEWLVKAEDALEGLSKMDDVVNQLASTIEQAATRTRTSMRAIGKELTESYREVLKEGRDPRLEGPAEGEIQKVKKFEEAVSQAITEINQKRRESLKEFERMDKANTDRQKRELQSLRKAHTEYVKITRQGYGEMSKAAQQYGQQINRIRQQIQQTAQRTGQSWNQVAESMARTGTPVKQINLALQQLNTQAQQTTGRFGGLLQRITGFGNISKLVFGGIIGVTAVQAFQRATQAFMDFAKEIVRRGTEMSEIMFTFQVSIRGLQRLGLDTTIEGWTERLQELKSEFPFFPKREFIEAATLASLMTREFGFTEEQIANIVRQSVILAQVTGKDLMESVRGITFAIGSGYFESLQRAGVNISRAVVKNEALAQGYEGVYNELEPTIRAQVTYNVIQKNLAAIQDDASRKTNTWAGQVLILHSRFEDLKNLFGEVVTSSDTLIESLRSLNETLGAIHDVYSAIQDLDIDIFYPFRAVSGLDVFIERLETIKVTLIGIANVIGALAIVADALGLTELGQTLGIINDIRQALEDLDKEAEGFDIPLRVGDLEFTPEEYKEIKDSVFKLNKEIAKIDQEAQEKRDDVWKDFYRDQERNTDRHFQKLADLAEDHQQRLADIETRRTQRIADEIANYNFRVTEAQRDAAFRREEAERKYRERELKEERRFQEKLRQLRENFLFELEDAVRERDARQIIRLTRQFNLRRDQMIREEKLSKGERATAFQEELRQIEFQRQERLRQLAIEHTRRLQEIDLQAQRERDREKVEFERRQEAENERWIQQNQDLIERREERLKDLEQWTQDRIDKVIGGLIEEYGLTQDQLLGLEKLYNSFYGPEGRLDASIQYHIDRLMQLADLHAQVMARLFAGRSITPREGGDFGLPEGFAEGGTIIARKPTVALFGEAGPEMATFTPLNKLGEGMVGGQAPVDGRQSLQGRLRLEMLLSPDLEARITDNTLDEVADVIYTIERERR